MLQRRRSSIIIKTEEQIEGIRNSGKLTSTILDMLQQRIGPGVTTDQIDQWVYKYTVEHGAQPGTLNYEGYPKSVCTSLNSVVCHGIPDGTVLCDGDILNVDVTTVLNGYYGDASRMYVIGQPSDSVAKLVRVAAECLLYGVQQVKPLNTLGDIGFAIQHHAESNDFSVVRGFGGHGVGVRFHEEPIVLHFGRRRTGMLLVPNMTFTIEPMINAGRAGTRKLSDGWTVVTEDGSLSAQWEFTVRVTDTGVEVLAS